MQLHKQQTTLIKLGRIMRTPNGQLQTAHRTAFDKLKTVENAQLTPPCIVGENFFSSEKSVVTFNALLLQANVSPKYGAK